MRIEGNNISNWCKSKEELEAIEKEKTIEKEKAMTKKRKTNASYKIETKSILKELNNIKKMIKQEYIKKSTKELSDCLVGIDMAIKSLNNVN